MFRQMSVETDTETTAPINLPKSAPPAKKKTALALLNESSDSEVVLDNNKSTKTVDSEDDFDFFD